MPLRENKFETLTENERGKGRGRDLQAARIAELLRPDLCRSKR